MFIKIIKFLKSYLSMLILNWKIDYQNLLINIFIVLRH